MDPDPSTKSSSAKSKTVVLDDHLSFAEGLKTEWQLFWHGLLGSEDENSPQSEAELVVAGRLKSLTVEQIKQISRALSQDRKRLNQHMEKINSELENSTQTIENLKLVGGDPDEVLAKLHRLTDAGQQLSLQLQKVDEQLKKLREQEKTKRQINV